MNGLTQDEFEQARIEFNKADSDGSGFIENSEMGAVMTGLGYNFAPQMIQNIMGLMDLNNSGKVSFDEFTAFYARAKNQ